MRSTVLSAVAAVVLAFLLATNPVLAEAAKKITGKQIKNGTVTSADLKNHTVKSIDIKDGAVSVDDLSAATVDALSTTAHRYLLPGGGTPSGHKYFSLGGLPSGTYLFSYSVLLSTPVNAACYFKTGEEAYEGLAYNTENLGNAAVHGSGVVEVSGGVAPPFACSTQDGATLAIYAGTDVHSTVVLRRIDGLVEGTAETADLRSVGRSTP